MIMPRHPDTTPDGKKPYGLMQVLKAGTVYFLVALGTGFVLEFIRTQVVALHIGERVAGLMEIPDTLLATIVAARWTIDQFTLPPLPRIRLGVGLVAFILVVIAEFMVILPIRSLSVDEYFASQNPSSISASIGTLGVLTVMPFLASHRW